jgi:predicted PurR-regulated permease PerM
MSVNVNDLLIFLAVFIGISLLATVCVLLIITVVRLNRMLKRAGKLLDDNADNIDKTMKKLPVLAQHWDETSETVRLAANKTETTIGVVSGFLTGETAVGGDGNTVQSIVTIVESALQIVLGYYANKE